MGTRCLTLAGVFLWSLGLPAVAAAQTVAAGRDVCGTVWFHDEPAWTEFTALSRVLERTERHEQATRAGAEALEQLLKRLSAIPTADLVGDRLAAEKAARESAQSPELAGVQTTLTRYCLDRMRRSPRTFTDAVLTHAARLRRFAALTDERLITAFRTDTEQIIRDFGTPEATARTVRIILAGTQ